MNFTGIYHLVKIRPHNVPFRRANACQDWLLRLAVTEQLQKQWNYAYDLEMDDQGEAWGPAFTIFAENWFSFTDLHIWEPKMALVDPFLLWPGTFRGVRSPVSSIHSRHSIQHCICRPIRNTSKRCTDIKCSSLFGVTYRLSRLR